ncbi:lipopolysaccharide biosynthesis protein [Methylomonas sp. 2BW1-5-20]|uniref:lipopolysaccharide biosynthesis protein n=1 Tax=Methylomonas sp. 2BW1-5-20 TaxID=3376686 RepID=UPI00404D4F82
MDIKPVEQRQSLASKSISALKWNYIGRLISLSLQFIVGIVLARLLGPEPFGLVAIALFVQGLGNLFAEGGLSSALIQSQNISEFDIRSVFSTQLVIGVLITCLVISLAPLLAVFFNEPNATPVIIAMSFSFTIQALGQTSSALIKKNLAFKKIQIISLFSYCVGYLGLGLSLAYLDYGVWSLVAAQLSQVSLNAFITYFSQIHPIRPFVNPKKCRFLRFGAAITLNNITSWGISNLDTAIIGRSFETATLGVYNRVFNLVNMPMYAVVSSMQSVLFSAYSKSQSNRQILRCTFVASTTIMALLFLPFFGAMAAVPDLIINSLYGSKWVAAIPLMTPLCFAMAINAMLAMSGPLLSSIGLPQIELKAQLAALSFSIPSLILAAQYSVLAVAWTLLGTYVFRLLLLVIATLKAVGDKPYRLFTIIIMPLVIAILLYGQCWYLGQLPCLQAYSTAIRLSMIVFSCALSYPFWLLLFRRLIICGNMKEFLVSLQNKLPVRLFKLVGLAV